MGLARVVAEALGEKAPPDINAAEGAELGAPRAEPVLFMAGSSVSPSSLSSTAAKTMSAGAT